jgi:hypothetical protein
VGANFGECLQGVDYPNERLMLVGNPKWQQFWLEQVHAKHWGQSDAPTVLADGVFADNTRYTIPWQRWVREGRPDAPDLPADYCVEGRTGHVYMREFQDGWAVVNPTTAPAAGIAVPRDRARVIDHDALEQPESRPLVEQFLEEESLASGGQVDYAHVHFRQPGGHCGSDHARCGPRGQRWRLGVREPSRRSDHADGSS